MKKLILKMNEKSFWTYRQGLIRRETVTVSVRTRMRSLLKVCIQVYIRYYSTESSAR